MSAQWVAITAAKDMFQLYMGLASPTPPSSFYLALSPDSADPTVPFNELSTTGYSRQAITWTYGGDVFATNDSDINFTFGADDGVIGQGIFDDGTIGGGNLLFWADMAIGIDFTSGYTLTYPAGQIKVGLNV